MYLPWSSYARALYFTDIASYIHSSEAGCILMYALAIILKGERDVENRSFTNWKLNRLCMSNFSRGRGIQSLSPLIQLRGVQLLLVACFPCKQPLSSLEVPSSVHGSGYKLLKSSYLLEQRITAMLSCNAQLLSSCFVLHDELFIYLLRSASLKLLVREGSDAFMPTCEVNLRPEEDQSIWSKRREAGIREPTLSNA